MFTSGLRFMLPLAYGGLEIDSEAQGIVSARWSCEVQFISDDTQWLFLARLEWCSRFPGLGGAECKVIQCYDRSEAWELCLFMALMIIHGAKPEAAFEAAERRSLSFLPF